MKGLRSFFPAIYFLLLETIWGKRKDVGINATEYRFNILFTTLPVATLLRVFGFKSNLHILA